MRFDICGPLPTGVTVLEASAGTGKTYTIAALAARYVADGTPLHKLLLAAPPLADERDWFPHESSRLGVLSRRLWDGLFAHEKVVTP